MFFRIRRNTLDQKNELALDGLYIIRYMKRFWLVRIHLFCIECQIHC